jgi:hypothetical protein
VGFKACYLLAFQLPLLACLFGRRVGLAGMSSTSLPSTPKADSGKTLPMLNINLNMLYLADATMTDTADIDAQACSVV